MNRAPTATAATRVDDRSAAPAARTRSIEDIFHCYAAPVHNYLRAAGATDAEDVLGDVFVAVLRGLDRFRGSDEALRRWVFTIAHHRLVDEHRRRARRRHVLHTQAQARAPDPAEPIDPALIAALDALTPAQREVVVLRFVADLSIETVAAMTKRPVGAVKSLQHRALLNLATALA